MIFRHVRENLVYHVIDRLRLIPQCAPDAIHSLFMVCDIRLNDAPEIVQRFPVSWKYQVNIQERLKDSGSRDPSILCAWAPR